MQSFSLVPRFTVAYHGTGARLSLRANVPVPQHEEFGSDQPTLEDLYRIIEELFDKSDRRMDELADKTREIEQRSASLEHDAQQPRLAMGADVPADKKTSEHTEGAAIVVQAKHGVSCSAKRVQAGPISSITFGVKAEPPALPCRDDVLIENGTAAPKSYLSPLEMRTPIAAGGLLAAGTTSTATRTTLYQLPLWFCPTEDIHLRTSIQNASYYSSFWWINNQQAPFWPRVIETELGKNLVFNPGGRQVVSAPARFWNVARVALWEGVR